MKRTLRTLAALLLVAVTAVLLPLNALATTYSDSYGTILYSPQVSGSTHSIYSYFSVSTSSRLKLKTAPYALKNGEYVHYDIVDELPKLTTIAQSYTYEQIQAEHPNIYPLWGHYDYCYYYDYINGHVVLNGAYESF